MLKNIVITVMFVPIFGVLLASILASFSTSRLASGYLHARPNPFTPNLQEEKSIYKDGLKELGIFKTFSFELPTTTRIIKSITITYQGIDGSIMSKKVAINKIIDWHYPLEVTQKGAFINQKVTNYYAIKPYEFTIDGKMMFITISLPLLRNFILPSPFSVVMDFKRLPAIIHETMQIKKKYFSGISVETFDTFYRVKVMLDGHYKFKILKTTDGYMIKLLP